MEHLNTAVENRAKEEGRKREEERRHNEENERRRKMEERKSKEERRKSGVGSRDSNSREKSPSKQIKNSVSDGVKEDRRRDSKGNGGRRSVEEGRRSGSQQATINPLLSEVSENQILL